jgi:CubicO group peptidase (beta-lactamase class C family)
MRATYLATLILCTFFLSVPSAAQTANGINEDALKQLVAEAEKSHSSALVVMKDGALAGEWYFGGQSRRIETMSVTKSIVSMAIGRLLTTGAIKSIDQPVSDFYPEWKQGKKATITLKHLLNHTSGLQSEPRTTEIYQSPDFVQLALAAELSDSPGSKFSYNNKAANLLAGIVSKAAGKPVDEFCKNEIFAPLGIVDFSWSQDRSGNPHGMSGLKAHPRDLAKLGQLMANKGRWENKVILDAAWVEAATHSGTAVSPEVGLLWWINYGSRTFNVDDATIDRVKQAGADATLIEQMNRLKGRYESAEALNKAIIAIFEKREALREKMDALKLGDNLFKVERGEAIGFRASGYLGQFILVLPESGIVAVRMIEQSSNYDEKTDGFREFERLVRALVTAKVK